MAAVIALSVTLTASFLTTGDGCTQGFPTTETVNLLAEECTMIGRCAPRDSGSFAGSIYVIPTMNFTCNGRIMSWRVAGFLRNGGQSGDARLLILRPSSSTLLSAVTTISSLLACNGEMLDTNSDNVYECSLNDSVTVQPGDVLGIRLPTGNDPSVNSLAVHFSTSAMPVHDIYIFRGSMDLSSLDLTSPDLSIQRAQPLVALEVARNDFASTTQPGTTPTENSTSSPSTAQPGTRAMEGDGNTVSTATEGDGNTVSTTTGGNTDMTNGTPTPLPRTSNPDVTSKAGGMDTPQTAITISGSISTTVELASSISPQDISVSIALVVVTVTAVSVAVVLVLGAAVIVCFICYHKRRKKAFVAADPSADLNNSDYEIPGEPILTERKVEVPFAMSSSPAYGVSATPHDTSIIMTLSPAYGITVKAEVMSNAF